MTNMFFKLAGSIALAASSAFALEKDLVDRIIASAKNIEQDATSVDSALKSRKAGQSDVSRHLESMTTDLAKLQEVVSHFDSSNPSLSDRDRADWQLVKDKVQLLGIFHEQKKALVAEDVSKHRGMIRAHAKGVAVRAQKLQETAARLRRG